MLSFLTRSPLSFRAYTLGCLHLLFAILLMRTRTAMLAATTPGSYAELQQSSAMMGEKALIVAPAAVSSDGADGAQQQPRASSWLGGSFGRSKAAALSTPIPNALPVADGTAQPQAAAPGAWSLL